jgi:hypothetical protein
MMALPEVGDEVEVLTFAMRRTQRWGVRFDKEETWQRATVIKRRERDVIVEFGDGAGIAVGESDKLRAVDR